MKNQVYATVSSVLLAMNVSAGSIRSVIQKSIPVLLEENSPSRFVQEIERSANVYFSQEEYNSLISRLNIILIDDVSTISSLKNQIDKAATKALNNHTHSALVFIGY